MLIELSNGLHASIDDEDFDLVKGYRWHANANSRSRTVYAISYPKEGAVLMHRIILDTPKGLWVDHIDHNGLNNVKSNIRVCTPAQNLANRQMSRHNKLGIRGVRFRDGNRSLPYEAEVKKGGKRYRKRFATVEEASKFVEVVSIELHGEFAFSLASVGKTTGR